MLGLAPSTEGASWVHRKAVCSRRAPRAPRARARARRAAAEGRGAAQLLERDRIRAERQRAQEAPEALAAGAGGVVGGGGEAGSPRGGARLAGGMGPLSALAGKGFGPRRMAEAKRLLKAAGTEEELRALIELMLEDSAVEEGLFEDTVATGGAGAPGATAPAAVR
jgi:hypothetical protein